MNNLVQRRIVLTADWQPVSAVPLVASVDVSCLPQNVGLVWFQGDDGSEVPWLPGEWHSFQRIDLGVQSGQFLIAVNLGNSHIERAERRSIS